MGKPRMIILIRHAQSEGNKNRGIHQFIPDHRVKLTPDGWLQAEESGRRLRSMLKPDDTLQFFTSPYRRTRETTQGILRSLTSDDPSPSPFPRHKIKVFEEPRLREQDFGNFQPCSAEMERMWQERADYGHFFYRIPNGESAADAYDRISGFNESMWRLFSERDFPSVCVLVTHGLMTRVFLMKWYHWSVEYFEDLRNVNHCEFILMKLNPENGRYILQNQLRTWSELKRRTSTVNTSTSETSKGPPKPPSTHSPVIPARRWGGCASGCNHDHANYPRRPRRQNTQEFTQLPPSASVQTAGNPAAAVPSSEQEDHPIAAQEADNNAVSGSKSANTASTTHSAHQTIRSHSGSDETPTSVSDKDDTTPSTAPSHPATSGLHVGRDFGGSRSGVGTPSGEGFSDDSDYPFLAKPGTAARAKSKPSAKTKKSWREESGMGKGARADALGDGGSCSELDEDEGEEEEDREEGGDGGRVVEETPEGWARDGEVDDGGGGAVAREVERAKGRSRQGFGEVY